jgi:hypothetical protein
MGGGDCSFDFSDKAVVARNKTASTRNLRFIIHHGSDRRVGALMLRPARRGCYNILRSLEQSIGAVVRARDGVPEMCGLGLKSTEFLRALRGRAAPGGRPKGTFISL